MNAPQPVLFLLGANHRSAPLELRERLHIPEERLESLLPEVKERYGLLEICALSTCNRFELFGVAPEQAGYATRLFDAFADLQKHAGSAVGSAEGAVRWTPVELDRIRDNLYLHFETDAVSHLYRVASSLDSLVLGETQITGQFKDALALAARSRTIGPLVARLGQEALATAKKVRTQTAIGRKHVSIAHAALDLAKKIYGDLGARRFLVIGAGEMSMVAARHIQSYQPKTLFVANRTVARARALVAELKAGEAYGLEELPSLLAQADIVVSCTASQAPILDAAMVAKAQSHRRGRPLILLDIALPRDVDPACAKVDDVYLFDIDDLMQVVDANYEERRKAADEAETLIDRGVDAFRSWQRTLAVKPALASFRTYLSELLEREAAKTLSREIFRDLTEKQKTALAALIEAIGSKIAADAARQVTSPPDGYYQTQLADALAALFPQEARVGGAAPQKAEGEN